jgi:hypothetical protein
MYEFVLTNLYTLICVCKFFFLYNFVCTNSYIQNLYTLICTCKFVFLYDFVCMNLYTNQKSVFTAQQQHIYTTHTNLVLYVCLAVIGVDDGNDNRVPSLIFSPSPPSYSPHASASRVAPYSLLLLRLSLPSWSVSCYYCSPLYPITSPSNREGGVVSCCVGLLC